MIRALEHLQNYDLTLAWLMTQKVFTGSSKFEQFQKDVLQTELIRAGEDFILRNSERERFIRLLSRPELDEQEKHLVCEFFRRTFDLTVYYPEFLEVPETS